METNISMAKQLIEHKRFNEAIDVLNSYIKVNNSNWEAFFELGKIFFINNNFELSVKNLKIALKLYDNKYIKLLLAKSLKVLGLRFRSLKLFLSIRKNNKDLKDEIDNEVISMFLAKKDYLTTLKYIYNYNVIAKQSLNIKEMLQFLKIQIGILNFNGDYVKAKNLSVNTLKKLRNLDLKTKNVLLNEIEIANNETCLKSFPRILKIDITQNCNLRCKMCKAHLQKTPYGKIQKTDLKILNILFKYAEDVEWQGGEPFSYKYFKYFIDLANKNKLKQSIISNGLLLNDEYIKKIVDYNIELTLSIDSVYEKIYENIRFGGKFKLLLKNKEKLCSYRKLKNSNAKLKLNAVLSRWNYKNENNFIDIIEFANKYNFTDIDIYCDLWEEDLELKREYIKIFNTKRNDLISLAEKYGINLSIQVPQFNSNLPVSSFRSSVRSDSINFPKKYCLLPWKKVHIKFDKVVLIDGTCPKIGVLSSNTKKFFMNEIWNGEKVIKIRKNIICNDIKYLNNICRMANYRFLRKG